MCCGDGWRAVCVVVTVGELCVYDACSLRSRRDAGHA